MGGSEQRTSARALFAVCLLLAFLALASFGQYCLSYRWNVPWAGVAWPLGLLALAAYFLIGARVPGLPSPTEPCRRRTEWVLASVAVGVGVFFKVYKLSEFPPGLNHDAAWEGQYALAILRGIPYTPFISAAWGRETLTFYLRAPFVWWLGNEPLAVYLPSVIAGIVLLPFLYWWARTMFGVRTAVLATALLGVSGWSLVFSRTGWRSDFQPLFTILACCFFWRGLATARAWPFALAGVFVAATANTYNAGQAFPLVFAIWLPLFASQGWTLRGFLRRYGLGLAAGILAFAAAIAPLAWYALNNWEKFFGRQSYLLEQSSTWEALRATVLIFHYWANGDDFFTNTPGLEFVTAVFFPAGLVWCLACARDPRAQFLLVGFLVGLLPGLLSKPNMNRDIGTMPFVYFFAALGVVLFARELAARLTRRWNEPVAAVLAAAVVAASAWATYAEYLGPHRRLPWGYYPETTVLGQYLAKLVPDYRVWVAGGNFPTDTLVYLTYKGGDPFKPTFTKYEDATQLLRDPLPPAGTQGLAFALANETPAMLVLAELRNRYPQHRLVDLRYPPDDRGRIFARVLLVPPAEGAAPPDPAAQPAATASEPVVALELEKLREPRAVALFGDGSVVVSDFGHDRLVWFDSALQPKRAVGKTGTGLLEFRQPSGLAIGPNEELYVCDTWNHRIVVLTKTGEFRRQYLANFFSPRGVAVGRDGTVFVADSGNNRVVVLDRSGQTVAHWDGSDGRGALREPVGIAVDDKTGVVFVTDNGSASIRVFSKDGQEKSQFDVPGIVLQALSEPQLFLDPRGLLWVAVPHAREVRAYSLSGKVQHTLPLTAQAEQETPMPMGVAVDQRRSRVLVATLQGTLEALPLPKTSR